mgnify:CR=1 FL=1
MKVVFTKNAAEDLKFWQKSKPDYAKKINKLILAIITEPFAGIGKPEPLRHDLAGKWSRRIDKEHRLVYEVVGNQLIIHQCRYHY